MRVKEIGEFKLIERLTQVLGKAGQGAGHGVIRGIGDDAAVLQATPGQRLLASCDLLIEGQHFDLSYTTPRQLGKKALAVNLSDIAAMGGKPKWALVSLGIKPDMEVEFIEKVYEGLAEIASLYGVTVVGGDTCQSREHLVIDICILGEVSRGAVALRSSAEVGDLILVTGSLGKAAAGLAWLQQRVENNLPSSVLEQLVEAQLDPKPRVRESHLLIRSGIIRAMNDLSDGLASEINEIASASNVGALIWAERLPIGHAVQEMARACGVDPLSWAISGGEDYELLFTVATGKGTAMRVRQVARSIKKATGTPITIIGRITPPEEGVRLVKEKGETVYLTAKGFNHFL